MKKTEDSSAQAKLVNAKLDWGMVSGRLNQYSSIRRHFPMDLLQRSRAAQPYYCHPLAWRLGTWIDGSAVFAHLDHLLEVASSMDNWESEKSLLQSSDYSEFWSIIWQLQVAEHLTNVGTNVAWLTDGPDLTVTIDGERWFVECYCYRKSYGLYLFLEDILSEIHPQLKVHYSLCMPLSLPRDKERNEFLNNVLSPFLHPEYLEMALHQSKIQYPVVLEQRENFRVYVDGTDLEKYMPGIVPSDAGSPLGYLRVLLKEVSNNKANSNSLASHRPNLIAANLLLSGDFKLADGYAEDLREFMPKSISTAIDALAISTAGIDKFVNRQSFRLVHTTAQDNESLMKIVA